MYYTAGWLSHELTDRLRSIGFGGSYNLFWFMACNLSDYNGVLPVYIY